MIPETINKIISNPMYSHALSVNFDLFSQLSVSRQTHSWHASPLTFSSSDGWVISIHLSLHDFSPFDAFDEMDDEDDSED